MPDVYLVKNPVMSPSACAICHGNHDTGGFVDSLSEIPLYGRVYLCAGCAGMCARQLGWIEPRVAQELRQTVSEQHVRIGELTLEVERAEGRGSWTWTPDKTSLTPGQWDRVGEIIEETEANLVCPDCGGPKGPTSERCRKCYLAASKAEGAAA